jgi:hypothetical protein
MLYVLIILAAFCMVMASIQIVNENKKAKARKAIKQKRNLSCIPWDAADRLKAFLEEDRNADKEYKLAALVVVDENGNMSIEDIDLRGDNSEIVRLSSFAYKRTKNKADKFLFDYSIVNTIANKVNCIKAETERYYAFELTKENVLSGRHGKMKKKIKDDFVMLLDLDKTELKRIANLSF